MIVVDGITIGAVWIELFENHGVKSPSIHIILGNPEYRGKGVGTLVMKAAMKYAIEILGAVTSYKVGERELHVTVVGVEYPDLNQ